RTGLPQELRLFLTTGILGGFTTFSTFSLDAVGLWERGEVSAAILYASASVILAFIVVFAGMALVRGMVGGQTA
ncbi:fluoride efflux transporter CrcB, partial [Agrobacterium rubi]|nr:fluoride efflux transporter CrcB [Agrobacterium rubi]